MTDRSFPLALPGMVHVRNRIEAVRPIGAGEPLDLQVWAERYAVHRKGATVDLCAACRRPGRSMAGTVHLSGPRREAPDGEQNSDITVPVGRRDPTYAPPRPGGYPPMPDAATPRSAAT